MRIVLVVVEQLRSITLSSDPRSTVPVSAATNYFMTTAAGTLYLECPEGLESTVWSAIDDPLQRLNRALAQGDLPLVVGTCKDLAEAVAKVVLAARGETTASNEKFPTLMASAQAVLDRQPGRGLAADEAIRLAAQSALKTISYLPELRNRVGTGHGRALAPEVAEEVVLVSVDMAMMWCRWALRRLRHVIYGRPESLITSLSGGGTFYRGDLTARLEAARLSELAVADQSALGIAVAHRALRDTFLIREEGVERCAQSSDRVAWPEGYRTGLIAGLLINSEGQIETTPWAVRQIGLLLAVIDDPVVTLINMAAISKQAWLSPRLGTETARMEVQAAMHAEDGRMSSAARSLWWDIGYCIVPPPF